MGIGSQPFHALALVASLLLATCGHVDRAEPLQGDLLISHVRTIGFAGDAAEVSEAAFVLIRDGGIIAVQDSADGLSATKEVDGTGLTMIPGLTDMHVHVWDEAELGAYLSYGVTRVRNMSGMPFHLDLQQRIESGELAGPHLVTTGPILNSAGPNMQINHQLVEDAGAARAAVVWQYETGFRRLKVYSNLKREPYEAILEEAAARGMTVSGHTPEGVRAPGVPLTAPFDIGFEEILDDGFETIEHVESIVWHGLRDQHDADAARALARKIAETGVPVTPTLLAHHNLWLVSETKGEALTRPGTEMLNAFVQQMETANQQAWAARAPETTARNDAFYGEVLKIFSEEGVLIVAGTDAGIFTNIPGLSLAEEFALMVRAGLTPFEALKSATHNPSVVLETEGQQGCLSVGCLADLVLYACDPLANIACTYTPAAVVRGGTYLDADALQALRANAARQDIARTQENLLGGLAAQGIDVEALMQQLQPVREQQQ